MGETARLRGKAHCAGFGLGRADLGCLQWLAATWHGSLRLREGVQAEDTDPRGTYL